MIRKRQRWHRLDQARASVERIYTALRDVEIAPHETFTKDIAYVERFIDAMNDDFNTPEALAVLFEIAKELNVAKQSDPVKAGELALVLKTLGGLLGLLQLSPEAFLQGQGSDDEVAEIEALIVQRNEARASKNWAMADDARDKLAALNVILEDSANGTTWRKG